MKLAIAALALNILLIYGGFLVGRKIDAVEVDEPIRNGVTGMIFGLVLSLLVGLVLFVVAPLKKFFYMGYNSRQREVLITIIITTLPPLFAVIAAYLIGISVVTAIIGAVAGGGVVLSVWSFITAQRRPR
ncbi:MAG: hypothetical protein N3I86_09375 [Verrucomicrobiae bacterium]|nr:hypothetical protein [Verrucomicrobiae bacterium]MDW8308627.1 hypothetical protein [Verrucomicrobiales bacterium]